MNILSRIGLGMVLTAIILQGGPSRFPPDVMAIVVSLLFVVGTPLFIAAPPLRPALKDTE